MEDVEKELLEATGFKPKKEYPERQDYLAALAREVNGLDPDDFDQLSNEAADWFNAAAQALNDQDDLPDFDGTLPDKETEDDVEGPSEAEPDEGGSDTDPDESPEEAEEVEETPEGSDTADEPEEKPTKKVKKPVKKKAKEDVRVVEPGKPIPKDRPAKKLPHKEFKALKGAEEIEFDRYGLAVGTKNASAVAMLEKGCRMADITETLGGTYYNVVRRMVKDGHKLEKEGNGTLKITHKDDVEKSTKRRK